MKHEKKQGILLIAKFLCNTLSTTHCYEKSYLKTSEAIAHDTTRASMKFHGSRKYDPWCNITP